MDNETTIRTTDPAELLAFISYQLGFTPEESLVVLGMRADPRRTGLAARVDLRDVERPDRGPALLAHVAQQLLLDGATDAVLVVYTRAAAFRGADDPGVRRLVARVAAGLPWSAPGWWLVAPDGFCPLPAVAGATSPRPMRELESTQVAATMVLGGRRLHATRAGLAALPEVSTQERGAARRAAAQAHARRSALTARVAWRRGEGRRWSDLVARTARNEQGAPEELGSLLAALEDSQLRDQIISAVVHGDLCRVGRAGWQQAASDVLRPGGPAPDRKVVDVAVGVLQAAAAHGHGTEQVPALVLLAWLAWWCGEGARADVLLERCLAYRPEHRLARLLRDAVVLAVPPGWVLGTRDAREHGE